MEMVIGDLAVAGVRSDAVAATLGTETISFGELDARANRLGHALRELGVRHGDLVGWWSGPALHNLVGMLACARLGAVFAPMAPSLGSAEARAVLD
jgi:fatty-acyl-CoA synthase